MQVLRPGQRLGPYTLSRQVAVGGMAEIWAASLDSGETLALKVMLRQFAGDRELRNMFLDEVRIAMRLRHPNVVHVVGVHEIEGWFFQAMELLDGRDLRRILGMTAKRKARVPIPISVLIASDCARALGYAHALCGDDGEPLEIVHRDVSPHNIVVTREGAVKILDFGIARAKERITQTRRGVIKGKISYMAPEQAVGQPVTAQTDIYALGIVLWETLALTRLFDGRTDAEVLSKICEGRVPPIMEMNPDVPEPLAELVGRMLDTKPRNRPPTMRAVEESLKKVLYRYNEQDVSRGAVATWMAAIAVPKASTQQMPLVAGTPVPVRENADSGDVHTITDREPLVLPRGEMHDATTASGPELRARQDESVRRTDEVHVDGIPTEAIDAGLVLAPLHAPISVEISGATAASESPDETCRMPPLEDNETVQEFESDPIPVFRPRRPAVPFVAAPLLRSPASASDQTKPPKDSPLPSGLEPTDEVNFELQGVLGRAGMGPGSSVPPPRAYPRRPPPPPPAPSGTPAHFVARSLGVGSSPTPSSGLKMLFWMGLLVVAATAGIFALVHYG